MTRFAVAAQPRLDVAMLRPRRRAAVPSAGPGRRAYPFFWGRSAIYHGVRALGVGSGDTVLVPAYNCASIVDAIVQAGARVEYYEVDEDCAVDFADLARRMSSSVRAILAIHYFGFPQ